MAKWDDFILSLSLVLGFKGVICARTENSQWLGRGRTAEKYVTWSNEEQNKTPLYLLLLLLLLYYYYYY